MAIDTANLKKKPLLFTILVAEGALNAEQAERALDTWVERRARDPRTSFGQVVLSLGLMRPGALGAYVMMQRKLAGAPGSVPLGVLLVENFVLKPRQVLAALARLVLSGKRLGELLIEEGLVRRIQVDMLLQKQKRLQQQMQVSLAS